MEISLSRAGNDIVDGGADGTDQWSGEAVFDIKVMTATMQIILLKIKMLMAF